jgi:hypothetical protein
LSTTINHLFGVPSASEVISWSTTSSFGIKPGVGAPKTIEVQQVYKGCPWPFHFPKPNQLLSTSFRETEVRIFSMMSQNEEVSFGQFTYQE